MKNIKQQVCHSAVEKIWDMLWQYNLGIWNKVWVDVREEVDDVIAGQVKMKILDQL